MQPMKYNKPVDMRD